MINIKLESPVVLLKQIPQIAEDTGRSRENIVNILKSSLFVVTKDCAHFQKGWVVTEKDWKEADIPAEDVLAGSTAVVWLCKESGHPVDALTEVDIPAKVYREVPQLWMDISELAADVEYWNNRVSFLAEKDAPEVIMRNERRMLFEKVNLLEDTSWAKKVPVSASGRALRSLADVGYSLLDGWADWMQEEFDRRKEEAEKEEKELEETLVIE